MGWRGQDMSRDLVYKDKIRYLHLQLQLQPFNPSIIENDLERITKDPLLPLTMSRCVPNWDLDDGPAGGRPRQTFLGPDLPPEVAELTWENGQISLHGLGHPRLNSKPVATNGTLESLMNLAVPLSGCKPFFACAADLIPWFETSQTPTDVVATGSGTGMMDALVPCAAAASDDPRRQAVWLLADSAGHGDCRELGDHQSASGSAIFSHHVTTQDTYERDRELDNDTSEESPDNTQSGKVGRGRPADTTTEENDSVYSRPRRALEENRRISKSSRSTKRSRTAAIHNQSERKRRDKINLKMKTLQKLVPNSSKTDKASVLDEVIDYLKQLQAQVKLMSTMNTLPLPPPLPMMMPMALQQQLQMSMMAAPMLGLGLAGMPGIMAGDMYAALGVSSRPNIPSIPPGPAFLNPFMPAIPDPLSTYLANQYSPAMALDAYSRLAAIYQQQQEPHNPNN